VLRSVDVASVLFALPAARPRHRPIVPVWCA